MPSLDGTGPNGAGPKTGRQQGNCQGSEEQSRPRGQGRGGCGQRGMNFGRKDCVLSLDEQEKFLENKLVEVRQAKSNSKK